MDGKGRALDNVWIERFWKALKHNSMKEFKTTSNITTRISTILPAKVPMTDILNRSNKQPNDTNTKNKY
jgi:hypothetical protein